VGEEEWEAGGAAVRTFCVSELWWRCGKDAAVCRRWYGYGGSGVEVTCRSGGGVTRAYRLAARHAHEGDDVPGEEGCGGDGLPLASSVDEEREGFCGHAAELLHVLEAREGGGALEGEDHEEGEHGVLPVLVEHPQHAAQQLEDGDGRGELLLVQARPRRHRDRKAVLAVLLVRPSRFRHAQPAEHAAAANEEEAQMW
jgi:hypothetical protein